MKSLTLTFIILSFINIPAQERYINVTGKSELIIPADQVSFSIPIKINLYILLLGKPGMKVTGGL